MSALPGGWQGMIARRRGKIIKVASVAGLGGSPPEFQAVSYHASKGGVIIFMKDLACKWGMHNIQVNAIAPGWIPTDMSQVLIERNKDASSAEFR
jgi:NAD(P)-dependent dehydrogenase (short-subunit alcohol dehydrogenase family)